MFSSNEKEFLKEIVKKELESFKKTQKAASMGAALKFLKAEHEFGHFLEALLKKLQ